MRSSGLASLFILLLSGVPLFAETPTAKLAYWDFVEQHGRQEVTFQISFKVRNPYNSGEIEVDGLFSPPSGGTLRVPAFFFESAVPIGAERRPKSGWKIRFTPTEVGTYLFRVVATRLDKKPEEIGVGRFKCVRSGRPGFVARGGAGGRRFVLTTGGEFFPVGANLCWGDLRTPKLYTLDIVKLADAGANCIRIWLAPWWLPVERNLPAFNPAACARLDAIMSRAESLGLRVVLCIEQFGNLEPQGGKVGLWESHPYNSANGGPCRIGSEFFTHPDARHLFKNRLRYLAARWGYSTSLMTWELFNEVEFVPFERGTFADNREVVEDWHVEMANCLRRNDPFGHLISTSSDVALQKKLLSAGTVDFLQVHVYEPLDLTGRLSKVIARLDQEISAPILLGEFGPVADGKDCGLVTRSVFVAAMAGRGSGALPWLQDVAEADSYFARLGAARKFFSDIRWEEEEFELVVPRVETVASEEMEAAGIAQALVLRGKRMTLLYAYALPDKSSRHPHACAIQFKIPGIVRGEHAVEVWGPAKVVVLERTVRQADREGLLVPLAQFSGEVALKIELLQAVGGE